MHGGRERRTLLFEVRNQIAQRRRIENGAGQLVRAGLAPFVEDRNRQGLAALGLLYVADSVAMYAAVTLLQGVYRALDSGPLESWYVDTTLAAEPDAGNEPGTKGA